LLARFGAARSEEGRWFQVSLHKVRQVHEAQKWSRETMPEIMSKNDCWYCGKPKRGFYLLSDIYCEVCDTCIAFQNVPWRVMGSISGGRIEGKTIQNNC